ncbi:MAG: DNA polymerase I [Minisyncoccia bacterium]
MKKLVVIDGHALAHRSYHALPSLVSPKGILVNAVYGFLLVFLKVIKELNPDYLIATFDLKGPTFRHLQYKEYKAKRIKAPEDFYKQIEIIKEILKAFGVLILEKEGFEADDIIATIVKTLEKEDIEIIILTGDLDTLQLVNDKVSVFTFRKGFEDTIIYTPLKVKERFNLEPKQLIDFKALKGDPSDNIAGVSSIGEKTAQNLIVKYHNLDNLYNLLEEDKITDLSPKIIKTLKENKEKAYLSRRLVLLNENVPIEIDLNEASFKKPLKEKIVPLFEEYGFKSLILKLFPEEGEKQLDFKKVPIREISQNNLNELLEKISSEKKVGLMLDFKGEKVYEREVFGMFFVFDKNSIFYLKKENFKEFFEKVINLKEKILITHNAKVLYQEVEELKDYLFEDIKIKSWLLDPERRNYNLRETAAYYLKTNISFDKANEALVILPLNEVLENKLLALELNEVYEKIEKPLIPVLAKMEKRGIKLDKQKFKEMSDFLAQELDKLKDEIYEISGEKFNINSPLQLSKILFEKLKIESKNFRKTKSGIFSTNSNELKKIRNLHPLIPLIEKYRELKKIKSTFLDVFLEFINPKTQKVHTIFNQTGTATGRLSSEKPNFQNIPLRGEWGKEIRKCFIAEEGFKFLSFDYSQIELRIAAHLSQDSNLKEAFLNNLDIHTLTASKIYNIPVDKVTNEMRQKAKILNFGIIYGIGDKAFAEAADISLKEASEFKKEYFNHFIGLKIYLEMSLANAKKQGFVETIFKRKRFLPLIGALGKIGKEQERIAINMPIQGLASDLIKLAMIKIDSYLKEKDLLDRVFLVCQIHDELIFEVKIEIINEVKDKIKEIMENVYPLSVPLKVEVKIGDNWGEL